MWPGPVGAHSVQPMAFSPRTGLAYIPTTEYATTYADAPDVATWKPKPNNVVNSGLGPPPAGANLPPVPKPAGYLQAYDPVAQKRVWKVDQAGMINGGVAATAGNLVFQGQATGEFRAYAADTGKVLWSFDAQTGITANPITYEVDGKQYVTVIAGWRGMGGPSGAKPDWDYATQPRRVLTFVLDGKAQLPPADKSVRPFQDDPEFVVDAAKADVGKKTFGSHCVLCHGGNLVSGGTAPDLRKSPVPLSLDALKAVLHDGVLQVNGMPRFEEFTLEQVEGLQHWIRLRARESIAAQNAPAK
jgi:quinohemoprotein ethanol dehydrogenase